jgi:hypothetical protein
MASPLLPRTIPGRTAAKIAGQRYPAFKRFMEFLAPEGNRVPIEMLEQHVLHCPVTVEMYLTAERALDHRRTEQRERAQAGDCVV